MAMKMNPTSRNINDVSFHENQQPEFVKCYPLAKVRYNIESLKMKQKLSIE